MFRLPRELSIGDKIKISGIRNHDRESFAINFTNGINTPDGQNVACKFEANYDNNKEQLIISTILNGKKNEEVLEYSPSDYLSDQYFDISFELRLHENANLFEILISDNYLGTVELQHSLREITYITLSPGTIKVKELNFSFSNII